MANLEAVAAVFSEVGGVLTAHARKRRLQAEDQRDDPQPAKRLVTPGLEAQREQALPYGPDHNRSIA